MPVPRRFRPHLLFWLSDATLALVTGAITVGVTQLVARGGPFGALGPWGTALVAGISALLILRRVYPLATMAMTGTLVIVYYALLFPDGPILIAFLICAYTATSRGSRWGSVACCTAVLSGIELVELLIRDDFWPDLVPVLGKAVTTVLALVAGETVRAQRAYLLEVEHRADEAERTRNAMALNRANEERLRIARDLHDIFAHSLAMMNVQAKAALHRGEHAHAMAALQEIKDASKEAMADVRATVATLRQVDDASGTPTGHPAGQCGIERLAQRVRATGLTVRITVEGDEVPLPSRVGQTVFRIAQEALTNTVRHSAATSVGVRLRFERAGVVLDIEDDGPCAAEALHTGNGLQGMRERAEALGGEVTALPNPVSGFRVRAHLPLDVPA